jgi:hypothetical protein
MTLLARTSSNFKRQTLPLARDGCPRPQTINCLKVIEIWPWASNGGLTPRQTGRLTFGHKITLTFILRVDNFSNALVARQPPAAKKMSTEAEDIVGIRRQATTG